MKFNNLIEVRDYLETIPEDKWIKNRYYGKDGCACAIGHLAGEGSNICDTENEIINKFGYNLLDDIQDTNDNSENPKQAVIELLNQRIYELAN